MTNVYTLILAILTVESSYLNNIERPCGIVSDTVQFCLSQNGQWRIKTYAIDHDIHIYSLVSSPGKEINIKNATDLIKKRYSDIINKTYVIQFTDPNDLNEVHEVLVKNNLKGSLEVSPDGFVFYNPDNQVYKTKSKPS